MLKWLAKKSEENKKTDVEAAIENISGPVLRIMVGELHLATLYYDGSNYCLVYTDKFRGTGLSPFNPNDFEKGKFPEVDKTYRSSELWNAFASRLPSPNRDDYTKLLNSMGLSGTENPLIILGKVGKISIAKPWKLELVRNPKAS